MNKMIPLLVSLLGMACLLPPPLIAAEAPRPNTEQLIEQLASSSYAERMQAAEALRARGPAVLPQLRKARRTSDLEVQRRLQSLITALEAVAALEPRRVTLRAHQQPLSAVLRQIEMQTGYRLKGDEKEDPLCDLDVEKMPFWEVLERLGRASGCVISTRVLEDGLHLQRHRGRSPFVVISGPFRLEVTRLHEEHDFDFTAWDAGPEPGAQRHQLTLTVSVLAEPRFILLWADKVEVKTALGDNRKPLTVPVIAHRPLTQEEEVADLLRKSFQHETAAVLQRSSGGGKAIRLLRGTIAVRVVVDRKLIVVSENVRRAEGKEFRVGRDTLKITQAREDEEGDFSLRLAVPPPEPGVRWRWPVRVWVEDARGNRLHENSSGTSVSGGQHEIHKGYRKAEGGKVGPPARLIVEDWIILSHAIPFEIRDVPLP